MSKILRNDNVESNTRKGEGAGLACRRGEEGVTLWIAPGWSFNAPIPISTDCGDTFCTEKTSEAEVGYVKVFSNSCRDVLGWCRGDCCLEEWENRGSGLFMEESMV